jgi:NADPH:quinone reductase-like Zn-dependent oxidoreductase
VLEIDEVPMPEAAAQEVVIDVRAFGLNRAEIMFRRGEYPQYAPVLPSTLGYEASGTVRAVGPGVTSVKVGDAVSTIPSFKMGRYWAYGDVARVPEHAVAHFPSRLSWVEAAAIWMPYITAYGGLLEYGGLKAGEYVVIRAASSSVGVAAIQIARRVGAIPIAVTRDTSKRDFIQAQGPAHLLTSNQGELAAAILAATAGHGADMVFDPVSGPEVEELCRALAYHGRLFVYGRLNSAPTVFPVGLGLAKGITLRGYSIFEIVNFPERFARVKAAVYAGLEQGIYQPAVAKTFALDEIVAAHRYMESNMQQGKIVVTT